MAAIIRRMSLLADTLLVTELARSDMARRSGDVGSPTAEEEVDTEEGFRFNARGELVTLSTVLGWS